MDAVLHPRPLLIIGVPIYKLDILFRLVIGLAHMAKVALNQQMAEFPGGIHPQAVVVFRIRNARRQMGWPWSLAQQFASSGSWKRAVNKSLCHRVKLMLIRESFAWFI